MLNGLMPRARHLETFLFNRRRIRLDRDSIVAFRNRRLRCLVEHAYKNVPYYRNLFKDAGITPRDIRTEKDLGYIPVTSKRDMQDLQTEDILSRGFKAKDLITRRTSGSSGESSIIRRTWVEERILQSFRWRALRLLGWRIRDRVVNVGLSGQVQANDFQLPARLFNSLGFYSIKKIDCLQTLDKILLELEADRPAVITGYPGVLTKLARLVDRNGPMKNSPRFVGAGGETLTRSMKEQMGDAFRAPVYNLYGSHEFNLIAWECKETGELHVCDDNLLLEVQKEGLPAGEGERGEVIGTNLHSFAMPFIRFRLGDVVTRGSEVCPCGLPFSTIKSVLGRMFDYFHLPKGRIIHPYEITTAIKRWTRGLIRQHQIVQVSREKIVMKVVPFGQMEETLIKSLERSMEDRLGKGIEFRIMPVDDIKPEPSGKFRVSHSMVESDYEEIDWDNELFLNG